MRIRKPRNTFSLQLSVVVWTLISGSAMAQSNYPFVADDYDVPDGFNTAEFRLRMLTVNDAVKDYAAVMSSVEHLKNVWPGSAWPDGLTLEQDIIDLGWHQREFMNRTSFAYTVMTLNETTVLGCVYVDPTRKRGYDTEVFLWVRASELERGLDARLFAAVKAWLADEWPFENPGFPGRDTSWKAWESLPDEKW